MIVYKQEIKTEKLTLNTSNCKIDHEIFVNRNI